MTSDTNHQIIPAPCKPIANYIKELQSTLKDKQQELDTAVGGEKAVLVQQISSLHIQIESQQQLLDQCIQAQVGR